MWKSILYSTLLWVPGLRKAAESLLQPGPHRRLALRKGWGEWSEFSGKLPLSLQLSQAVAPLLGESVSQFI